MAGEVTVSITEKGKNAPQYQIIGAGNKTKDLAQLAFFTKQALISTAETVFREEISKGFDPDPIVRVDNRIGKSVDDVKAFGKIEYISRINIREAIEFGYEAILKRSPVVTGIYKSQNLVFFNGRQIASTLKELEKFFDNAPRIEDRDVFRFVNAAPYAHALERYGRTRQRKQPRKRKRRGERGKRGQRVLKPNGTYKLTERALKKKFRGLLPVFKLVPGDVLGITSPLGPSFRATYDPKGRYNSGFYLYPTIRITLSTESIKQ